MKEKILWLGKVGSVDKETRKKLKSAISAE
jgi:hypothetical protein